MSKPTSLASRLYRGDVSYDIVGSRKRWYTVSGIILLLALVGLFGRGLNFGIEFQGGAEFQVPSANCSVESVRTAARSAYKRKNSPRNRAKPSSIRWRRHVKQPLARSRSNWWDRHGVPRSPRRP